MEELLKAVGAGAGAWHEGKLFLEHFAAICHDTLHLIAGTAIWLAIVALGRSTVRAWLPLLLILMMAVANEAVDLWVEVWPSLGMQLGEGVRDIGATVAVPTLFTVLARWMPRAFAVPQNTKEEPELS